jgi:hypothetical protein
MRYEISGGLIGVGSLNAPSHADVLLKQEKDYLVVELTPGNQQVLENVILQGRFIRNGKTAMCQNEQDVQFGKADDGKLTLHIYPLLTTTFNPQLSIEDFRPYDKDEYSSVSEPISFVRNGSLYIEGARKYNFRSGELISMAGANGRLVGLMTSPKGLAFRFLGTADTVSLGTAGSLQDVTPTLLEWISLNHGVTLFWSIAAPAIGLLVGVLSFLGVLDK